MSILDQLSYPEFTLNMKKQYLLLCLPIFLLGCGKPSLDPDSLKVRVYTTNTNFGPLTKFEIRSVSSEPITLQDISVNNRRCKYGAFNAFDSLQKPVTLEIGQAYSNSFLDCFQNNIVKIDISTDKGDLTYTFY